MFYRFSALAPVPALVDIARNFVADLALATGQDLPAWLPTLSSPPEGWLIGQPDIDQAPTRIALHRNSSSLSWDGCEIVNLFAFTGSLPHEFVHANVVCTLQAIEADNIAIEPLSLPSSPGYDVSAALAVGNFAMNKRRVRGRYSAYLVQEAGDIGIRGQIRRGALVEHHTFVTAEADHRVHLELVGMVRDLSEALQSALA